MILTITRKEFLSNLMTFKFAVGVLLSLILVLLFTYVLMGDYQQELYSYNKSISKNREETGQIRVYRNLKPIAYRPPQILSIFSQGLEKHLGNSVLISLREVPVLKSAYSISNPLLSVFPLLDFSLIFKAVMSILALLLAYNVISGEKEDGTLKLMLSNSVPRHEILLGKFLGGLLSLTVAISIGFLVGMILLQSSSVVSFTGSDWIRIALIFLVSLIFISVLFNFGLFFSCITERSSDTLMLVLLFWVVFALVVPNLSAYLATQLRPIESRDKIDARVNVVWEELQAELEKFREETPYTGSRVSVRCDVRGAFGGWFPKIATRDLITRERKQNAFAEPLRIKYATKVWSMELDYLSGLKDQKHVMDYLSSVSPISVYERIISALSGTDLESFEKFVDRANGYRREVIDYLRSRTDGFSSLSYFTVATEKDIDEYTEACSEYYKARAEGRKITRKYFGLDKWEDKKWEDYLALDLRGLPVFDYEPEGVVETVRRILPDLLLLIFANLLLFLCAFVTFLRYDVR